MNKSYYTETLEKCHFQPLWAPSFQTCILRISIFNPRLYIVVRIIVLKFHGNRSTVTSYCTETMCLQTDDDNNLVDFDSLYLGNGKSYIKSVRWASSFQTGTGKPPIFNPRLCFVAWMIVLKFHGNR